MPDYPQAPRLDVVEDLHGHRVADPYRWLENPADDRTRQWSASQDALFTAARERWPGRDALRSRLGELLRAGAVGVPIWRGERRFFARRGGEQEHPVLMSAAGNGPERVLLDPMVLDPSGTTTLDAWQPSPDGRLLAYQLSEGGTEECAIRVLDVDTGEAVDGPIDRTRYSPVAWMPGADAFFYVRRLPPAGVPDGEQQYHRRVYLHRLGADPATDVMVFGDGLERTNYYGVSVSRDGRWLVVTAAAGTDPRNDLWLADLTASSPQHPVFTTVAEGIDAHTDLEPGRDGRLYIYTDRDAPRGRLLVTTGDRLARQDWQPLIDEDPEAVLEGYAILDGDALDGDALDGRVTEGGGPVLLCSWTRHAVGEISVHDLHTGARHGLVPLPGLGSVAGISERPEGGHEAWFGYTDHTSPPSVYRYDARSGQTSLWAGPPGAVTVGEIVTEQVTYHSADGTAVRMFVIHRPEADGPRPAAPRPTVLYGYGGFGLSLSPAYSATILAWVQAGGVYAVANLRGGGEEGEQWHRAGMGADKQRVFDDFHAAAGWLIEHGWTSASQLAISGGSNGGLLVGAALTQRPDLYAAAVCAAPLLDMVRYERFGLGQTWSGEFGSAADPEQLAWLLGYSPYHRVVETSAYPATLFVVFDSDTRVDPMHARKMCAALQHADPDGGPVLLRRESDAGHGARALSRTVEAGVDMVSFCAAVTKLALRLPQPSRPG